MPAIDKVKRRVSGLFSKKDKDPSSDDPSSTTDDGKLAPPSGDDTDGKSTSDKSDTSKPKKKGLFSKISKSKKGDTSSGGLTNAPAADGPPGSTEPGKEEAANAPLSVQPANKLSVVSPDADSQAAAGQKTKDHVGGDGKKPDTTSPDADAQGAKGESAAAAAIGGESEGEDKKEGNSTSPDADAQDAKANGEEKNLDAAAGVPVQLGGEGDKPVFDAKDITVIFVLGGPGAGKGTQCAKLVDEFGFAHLSAGDLLRAEQEREGSEFGEMIKTHIKEGKIVPMEVTVKLLQNAMQDLVDTKQKKRFLIDGFPRKMDQAVKFDEAVCQSSFVLFLTCPEDELLKRLLKRGETSGRADDNEESIKKRFKTFIDTSMPVVEHYREQDKVVEIESVGDIEDVYAKVKKAVEDELKKKESWGLGDVVGKVLETVGLASN